MVWELKTGAYRLEIGLPVDVVAVDPVVVAAVDDLGEADCAVASPDCMDFKPLNRAGRD